MQCVTAVEHSVKSPLKARKAGTKRVQKVFQAVGILSAQDFKSLTMLNLIENNKAATEDANLAGKGSWSQF